MPNNKKSNYGQLVHNAIKYVVKLYFTDHDTQSEFYIRDPQDTFEIVWFLRLECDDNNRINVIVLNEETEEEIQYPLSKIRLDDLNAIAVDMTKE